MRKIAGCIFLIVLLTSINRVYAGGKLYSTKGDTVVTIRTFNQRNFIINIHQSDNSIKIVYSLYDSTESIKEHADTAFQRFVKMFMTPDGPGKLKNDVLFDKLIVIEDRYTIYDRDSIILNANVDTAYFHLFNKVINTNEFEVKEKDGNGIRVYLDGTEFTYKIKTETGIRKVSAHSPTEATFPLLYALLNRSLNIYREKKSDVFLDKKRTRGY